MSVLLPVNYENVHCYDIMLERSFDKLYDKVQAFNIQNKRLCIVTESNVGPLYADEIKQGLSPLCKQVVCFSFPAGESSKNLDIINDLYEVLIENNFDRNDMMIALGGGVVGDMTGFAAATYLRGIDFIQVPTSLLSQVDSSIGGKTGVDFRGYKNMVGAFKQPRLVYMNLSVLKTLHKREYLSGMGEVIKHGFIRNADYLKWLEENAEKIKALDYETIEYMICESCKIKRNVVEADPKETLGERAKLNFGHTIGHAVEKLLNFELLHGECVSIGMVAALLISMQKNYITESAFKHGVSIIQKFELPVCFSELDIEDILNTTLSDKKMDSGMIKFILVKGFGNAVIDKSVTFDDMRLALETIKK